MSSSLHTINDFLDTVFVYGPWLVYLVVFLACFIENLFPPFPGDSFIVAAGVLTGLSRLHWAPALLTVIAGGMASVMVLYWLGRNHGRDFFIRKNYRYFSVDDISAMEDRLQRWGALVLLGSRFVVGLRAALALAAGIGRYPAGKMLLYSTISYVLFAGGLMYAAASTVEHIEAIEHFLRTYNRIVWPVVIVAVGTLVWHRVRAMRRRNHGRRA